MPEEVEHLVEQRLGVGRIWRWTKGAIQTKDLNRAIGGHDLRPLLFQALLVLEQRSKLMLSAAADVD